MVAEVEEKLWTDPMSWVRLEVPEVNGIRDERKRAVVVHDPHHGDQVVSYQSADYELISNRFAADMLDEIMEKTGTEFTLLKDLFNGRRFVQMYYSKDPVDYLNEDHPLHLGISGKNSYDASGSFGIQFYAVNFMCTNQYHSANFFGGVTLRHSVNSRDYTSVREASDKVVQAADRIIETAPRLRSMQCTDLSVDRLLDAHANISMPKHRWSNVLGLLDANGQQSEFDLYQALTYEASHEVPGFQSLAIGNSIGENFLPATN